MTAKMHADTAPAAKPMLGDRAEAVDLCRRLSGTIEALGSVMAGETEMLKAAKAGDIATLQDEKTELVRTYLKLFTEFKANAVFIGAQAPREVDRLRQGHGAFQAIMEANMMALEATRAAAQGVVGAIFEFASEKNAGPTVYGGNAGMASTPANRPTAIAFDRAL